MTSDPRKILIVLHGSIGDVTRALPLARLLRRAYPDAAIAWSVEPAAFPLVEHHPAVDEVILFDRRRWWRTLGPFLARIRAGRFDLVLDLQRHLKSGIVSRWSGAPIRLGFHRRDAKELNWLFNNRHISAAEGLSKLSHYLKFIEFLGLEAAPLEWGLRLTRDEEENVEQMLQGVGRPFAVFFVGGRWESKRWFPLQTAQSAAALRNRFGLDIVLLGGKEDVPFAREMESFGLVHMTNYVGWTSLREAAGILAAARLSVGPDTGLMHLSAAVGTPVVSLWGATSPARTGPYGYDDLVIRGRAECSPCYLKHCPIGRICMQSIDVQEVVAKVEKAIALKGEAHGARS